MFSLLFCFVFVHWVWFTSSLYSFTLYYILSLTGKWIFWLVGWLVRHYGGARRNVSAVRIYILLRLGTRLPHDLRQLCTYLWYGHIWNTQRRCGLHTCRKTWPRLRELNNLLAECAPKTGMVTMSSWTCLSYPHSHNADCTWGCALCTKLFMVCCTSPLMLSHLAIPYPTILAHI